MTHWEVVLLLVVSAMALFALDDLIIDLWASWKKAKPQELTLDLEAEIRKAPEKAIAIVIANWHEDQVLEPMIRGNLQAINYKNYHFFLGVYPNDLPTLHVAQRLERTFENVHCVVNSKPGPTSKGQMLNECLEGVWDYSAQNHFSFHAITMHDSEDVIHPFSLKVANYYLNNADFIQFPVFSFRLPLSEWVGGTYGDEFAEHHSKEMCLRSKLHRAVPSAGTGTVLSVTLIHQILKHTGQWMKEDCLTEDYHLGQLAQKLGTRSLFVCLHKGKDWVATREYFPKSLRASIRQKSRWALGIVFQGSQQFGWSGDRIDRYFLWRDRRSGLNALVLCSAGAVTLVWLIRGVIDAGVSPVESSWFFRGLVSFNSANLVYRIARRAWAVGLVSGWDQCWGLVVRWPIANLINVAAPFRAYWQFRIALKKGESPRWIKTEHELPAEFGRVAAQGSTAFETGGPI